MGPLLPLLGVIGRIFGGAGQGAMQQRLAENQQRQNAANSANQFALQAAGLRSNDAQNRADLELRQRAFQQQEPGAQTRNAVSGSLLSRIQPLQLSGLSGRAQQSMPTLNNSILSALGPEARQAGSMLANRSVQGLQNPTQFSQMPALQIPAMQQAALQKSGLLEKLLGAGGLIGSTVGAIGDLGTLYGPPRTEYDIPSDQNGYG